MSVMTTGTAAGTESRSSGPRSGGRRSAAHYPRREQRSGWLMALPWLVGFAIFTLIPMLVSAYYSLTSFSIFSPPQWVGLRNYQQLFADPRFYQSLGNTFYLAIIGVPLGLVVALATALVLNNRFPGHGFVRAIAYLPAIIPAVVTAFLWRWMFNGKSGAVNQLIHAFGLPAPNWLLDPVWTRPAVIIMGLWVVGGTTVIYLAALGNVPRDLYEAAMLDGAGAVRRFWSITLPSIAPVTVFQLISGLIFGLQIFTVPYLLGSSSGLNAGGTGGPGGTWLTYAVYLYQNAFGYLKMGYASAMAWILLLITLALTAVVLRLTRRWSE